MNITNNSLLTWASHTNLVHGNDRRFWAAYDQATASQFKVTKNGIRWDVTRNGKPLGNSPFFTSQEARKFCEGFSAGFLEYRIEMGDSR